MAYTQAQLDALNAALALGARSVSYSDPAGGAQRTDYNSRDEMLAQKRLMEAELGIKPPRPTTIRASHGKGLC